MHYAVLPPPPKFPPLFCPCLSKQTVGLYIWSLISYQARVLILRAISAIDRLNKLTS